MFTCTHKRAYLHTSMNMNTYTSPLLSPVCCFFSKRIVFRVYFPCKTDTSTLFLLNIYPDISCIPIPPLRGQCSVTHSSHQRVWLSSWEFFPIPPSLLWASFSYNLLLPAHFPLNASSKWTILSSHNATFPSPSCPTESSTMVPRGLTMFPPLLRHESVKQIRALPSWSL